MLTVAAAANPHLDAYYARLSEVEGLGITREEALRPAFFALLERYSREVKWVLIAEERLANGKRPDGTLYDTFKIPRGIWEAKDTQDDKSIKRIKAVVVAYARAIRGLFPATSAIARSVPRLTR